LVAVYPNPTSNEAVFSLNLSQAHHVKLTISNILGGIVQTVINDYFAVGRYDFVWNSAGLPSGTYPYRLDVDGFVRSGFVSVLR
jgi:acyl-[acyl carrier protein]--UDP-N-acetylglucosamine O-acyltransferase